MQEPLTDAGAKGKTRSAEYRPLSQGISAQLLQRDYVSFAGARAGLGYACPVTNRLGGVGLMVYEQATRGFEAALA